MDRHEDLLTEIAHLERFRLGFRCPRLVPNFRWNHAVGSSSGHLPCETSLVPLRDGDGESSHVVLARRLGRSLDCQELKFGELLVLC